ncbi:MAG TPA: molybdenum cofactor biosynthesis protein MoaB [Acidilobales archaeon]|nr:molybdenum cofactor biosynthesis protein MoaB [Acidilobales archaeon]
MPVEEHRFKARELEVNFCIIITSDSIFKGVKKDKISPKARELIRNSFKLKNVLVIPNDPNELRGKLKEFLSKGVCDAIIVTGGTGISKRDISVDVIKEFCDKELPGYGELFRYLTFMEHGTAAIASRAMACTSGNSIIFTTPGSPDAFTLAVKKLILPEIKHLIYELRR